MVYADSQPDYFPNTAVTTTSGQKKSLHTVLGKQCGWTTGIYHPLGALVIVAMSTSKKENTQHRFPIQNRLQGR